MDLTQLLEKSFVITVDDGRYRTFCSRFNAAGLDNPLPRKYVGFQIQNGMYRESGFIKTKNICNCWFSHISIVSMAAAMEWEHVCIFEDDALPSHDATCMLAQALASLPDDVDMLKLGHLGIFDGRPPTHTNGMFEVRETRGSHAYLIFRRYYGRFIDLTRRDILIDHTPMNDPSSNILTMRDMVFVQDDGGSANSLHNTRTFLNQLGVHGKLRRFERDR